jgi:hypothetical protein
MMKALQLAGVFFLLFLAVGCQSVPRGPALPFVVADDFSVERATFGIINVADDGSESFVEADRVPLVPGQRYGWLLGVQTTRETVAVTEVFSLPSAPTVWATREGNKLIPLGDSVSADRRTNTSVLHLKPENAALSHLAWAVAEGDPVGTYRMDLRIDGRIVATFTFEVFNP